MKQTLFLTTRKKMATVLWLCPDKLKQRRTDFPGVLCPQLLLHEYICFNLTILSQGKRQEQCQRSGLAVVLSHNGDDFLVNHSSHEQSTRPQLRRWGSRRKRLGALCYCLSRWKHSVNNCNCLLTVGKGILFDHRGFMCYSIHVVHFSWVLAQRQVTHWGLWRRLPWGNYWAPCTHLSFNCSVSTCLRRVVSCLHLWWPLSWDSKRRAEAEHSVWWIFDLTLFYPSHVSSAVLCSLVPWNQSNAELKRLCFIRVLPWCK